MHTQLPPILAIDDSEDDLFFLRRLLTKAGTKFPLVSFSSAVQAVEFLVAATAACDAARVPCFVFVDQHMPEMTGIEFVEWIRSQKLINRLPVALLTTSDDPRDIARGKEVGVDYYLVKFPTPEDIAKLLEEAGAPSRRLTT